MTEKQFKTRLIIYRTKNFPYVLSDHRTIMPPPEKVFEKKSLFKNYAHFMKVPLPDCCLN